MEERRKKEKHHSQKNGYNLIVWFEVTLCGWRGLQAFKNKQLIWYLLSQKAAEIADVESRHRRELEALQQQLMEAKRQAKGREAELRKEIDSLKRIITDLQDKLGTFWKTDRSTRNMRVI